MKLCFMSACISLREFERGQIPPATVRGTSAIEMSQLEGDYESGDGVLGSPILASHT